MKKLICEIDWPGWDLVYLELNLANEINVSQSFWSDKNFPKKKHLTNEKIQMVQSTTFQKYSTFYMILSSDLFFRYSIKNSRYANKTIFDLQKKDYSFLNVADVKFTLQCDWTLALTSCKMKRKIENNRI